MKENVSGFFSEHSVFSAKVKKIWRSVRMPRSHCGP